MVEILANVGWLVVLDPPTTKKDLVDAKSA